jgi:NAD(P)-dependent dehydrogenase (short-subunit alcohol dehydrogenase family)
MSKFDGKVALVTGAGSGIGHAMASVLAQGGAAVMCADINEQSAQATAARLEEQGVQAAAMGLDVQDSDAVKAGLERTVAQFGRLDILMNNAGIGSGNSWDDTIGINLSGVYYGLMHACPMMAASGGGAIVNTSSIAGLNGLVRVAEYHDDPPALEGVSAYVAAKHGVVGLTRQFALAFGKAGVRVNAVCPGYIVTPMTAPVRDREGGTEFLQALHPLGRLGEAGEVAAVAAFLASAEASFVTGVAVPVDGGYSAR